MVRNGMLIAMLLEPGEQFDPEFLERLRETAVSFAITQGETKAVDLKLSPRQ